MGFSKTGVPGLGILIVPLMAMVFPARRSVGVLLPMLITGDIFAITWYFRYTQWKKLYVLIPFVAAGMAPGFLVLHMIREDRPLKLLLAGIILVLIGIELLRRKFRWRNMPNSWWFSGVSGSCAGFGTAVGNAAGPVMSMYLVSRELNKHEFMGTKAWFFFAVNLVKVPFFIMLGMITPHTLKFNMYMVPAVITGVFLGFTVLPLIPQKIFNTAVILLALAAALKLLF